MASQNELHYRDCPTCGKKTNQKDQLQNGYWVIACTSCGTVTYTGGKA